MRDVLSTRDLSPSPRVSPSPLADAARARKTGGLMQVHFQRDVCHPYRSISLLFLGTRCCAARPAAHARCLASCANFFPWQHLPTLSSGARLARESQLVLSAHDLWASTARNPLGRAPRRMLRRCRPPGWLIGDLRLVCGEVSRAGILLESRADFAAREIIELCQERFRLLSPITGGTLHARSSTIERASVLYLAGWPLEDRSTSFKRHHIAGRRSSHSSCGPVVWVGCCKGSGARASFHVREAVAAREFSYF